MPAARRLTTALGAAVSLLVLATATPAQAGPPISPSAVAQVPDTAFRACLNEALKKPATAPLSTAELATITRLDCGSTETTNLTGLHHLTTLTNLAVDNARLSGSLTLPHLTRLRELDLSGNMLTQVSIPASMAGVTSIYLSNNRLAGLSLPTTMTRLERLDVSRNRIGDLGTLAWLPDRTFVMAFDQTITLPSAVVGRPTTLVSRDYMGRAVTLQLPAQMTRTGATLTHLAVGTRSFTFDTGFLDNGIFSGTFVQGARAQPAATGVLGDHTGDKLADIYGVNSAGDLYLFAGHRNGAMTSVGMVGKNWGAMTYLAQINDLSGDRRSDALARRGADNSLWAYRDGGAGELSIWRQLGQNWGGMDQIVPAQNLAGGRTQYVVARRTSDGTLHRYQITPTGLVGRTQIGSNWQMMRQILSVGDFTGDGRSDVLGIRNDGTLWVYRGTPWGTIGAGTRVGHGWGGFVRALSPGDLSGDGRPDLVGQRSDGVVFAYDNRMGTWSPARQIMTGTAHYRLLA